MLATIESNRLWQWQLYKLCGPDKNNELEMVKKNLFPEWLFYERSKIKACIR